jgi:hypothetical protein
MAQQGNIPLKGTLGGDNPGEATGLVGVVNGLVIQPSAEGAQNI